MNRIEMVNIALTALGASRISDLNDTTREEARIMESLYLSTVEEVLTLYPWPSAMKRTRLAQITDGADLTKWANAYQIPVDCCYIVSMLDPDSFEELELTKGAAMPTPITTPLFEREGSTLYTDGNECIVKYVKLPVDPDGLRDILGMCIGLRLAQYAAGRIGRDMKIKQSLEGEFERALLRAKAADGIDRRSDPVESMNWTDHR